MNYGKRAAELSGEIAASRHYLHQHAELSFKEQETTAYLVEELEKMGIPVPVSYTHLDVYKRQVLHSPV